MAHGILIAGAQKNTTQAFGSRLKDRLMFRTSAAQGKIQEVSIDTIIDWGACRPSALGQSIRHHRTRVRSNDLLSDGVMADLLKEWLASDAREHPAGQDRARQTLILSGVPATVGQLELCRLFDSHLLVYVQASRELYEQECAATRLSREKVDLRWANHEALVDRLRTGSPLPHAAILAGLTFSDGWVHQTLRELKGLGKKSPVDQFILSHAMNQLEHERRAARSGKASQPPSMSMVSA